MKTQHMPKFDLINVSFSSHVLNSYHQKTSNCDRSLPVFRLNVYANAHLHNYTIATHIA